MSVVIEDGMELPPKPEGTIRYRVYIDNEMRTGMAGYADAPLEGTTRDALQPLINLLRAIADGFEQQTESRT